MSKLLHPEEITLSNGIPVILQHYEGPVAATYWWNRVGSADERPDEAGFAHFLEHMHFKDAAAKETGRASTGKTALAIEGLGGDINAYTSFDQTVYHVTCAEQHWERVLDTFGKMAKPQRFLKEDFEREREVILEELRKNEDSPDRQLFQGLFSSTYRKHPYGRPVIGYVKTLKEAKVSTLERFYRRNYVPENMGIVLVGPVGDENSPRRKKLLKVLEKRFGAEVIRTRAAKREARPAETPLRKKPTFKLKAFDVTTPALIFAFRVPDILHDDIPALDVISGVLGMGESARLYKKLFYGSSLATDVNAGLYSPRDPGMLYFQAEMSDTSKIEPLCREMFDEINRIRNGEIGEEEVSRVIVNAESERLYSTQTADGMASRLGFLKFVLGDMNFDQDYMEKLRRVDTETVREVASRYLDYRRMSGAVLVPREEKDFDLAPIESLAQKHFKPVKEPGKPARKARSSQEPPSHVKHFERESGMRVVYFERPQSHVVSVHASAVGGLRLELTHPVRQGLQDWGAGYLLAQTWSKGTAYHDAAAIAAFVEGRAAGIEGYSGRNSIGLEMTGLARDWTDLSGLFSEILLEPAFRAEEIGHSRRVAEDALRGIEDHSTQLCLRQFLEALYETHPYGYLTYGSLETLPGIDTDLLKRYHERWIRPERLVVSVSGNVSLRELEHWLDDLDRRAEKALGGGAKPVSERVEREPALKAPRWVEKQLGREQIHIVTGGLGTTLRDEDRFVIRLIQTLLGGQSGRLFVELREKKSLAYTVAPLAFEGLEPGYVGTYIGCSPEKRGEAVAGIRRVLEKLAEKGPTERELKRAKEFYLGRRAMELQSDNSLASHYGLQKLYGIEPLEPAQLEKKLSKINARAIHRVTRKYFVEPPMVTSVVG